MEVPVNLINIYKAFLEFKNYPKTILFKIVFMIINDIFFVIVWLNFTKYKNIGFLDYNKILLILGTITVVFGLVYLFFGNLYNIRKIITGKFDLYFLRPRSIFFNYSSDYEDLTPIADLIFGLILLFLSNENIFIKFFLIINGFLIFIFFFTTITSISIILFTVSEQLFTSFREIFLASQVWPSFVIENIFLKSLLIFVIPGILVIYLPLDFVFNPLKYFKLYFIAILFWFLLATIFWKMAIKKYKGFSGL